MSYLVLARKWRPQSFQELVGQSHISQTLVNAIKNNRLHHALLFSGQRGTGKTSAARILAKTLRCPNVKDFVPCNVCPECQDIMAGRSLSVFEIDGASNNGVDAIRELRDTVGIAPSSGQYKIYIIDEVHMLTTAAFNALLKTLEEPPKYVIFIFATTEVHKIPDTIFSRIQHFDFRRISTRDISKHLVEICRAEKIEFEEEAIWGLARQADGSMRDAQSLLDQVNNFCSGQLTWKNIIEVLGLTDRALILDAVQGIVKRDKVQIVDVIGRIFEAGYDPKLFANDLLEEIRNLLMVKIAGNDLAKVVDLPDSEIASLREMGNFLSEEDIHFIFDMSLKGGNDIPKAQDPRLVLEMLLLRMVAAPHIESISQLLDSKNGVSTVSAHSITTPSASAPSSNSNLIGRSNTLASSVTSSAATKNIPNTQRKAFSEQKLSTTEKTVNKEIGNWLSLVELIKQEDGRLGATLENLQILSFEQKKISLGISHKHKFLQNEVKGQGFNDKLIKMLTKHWGEGYQVTITVNDDKASPAVSAKTINQQEELDKQSELERQVANHPLVKKTQETFNCEIKKVIPLETENSRK